MYTSHRIEDICFIYLVPNHHSSKVVVEPQSNIRNYETYLRKKLMIHFKISIIYLCN